eukprot:174739_1
MVIFRQHFPFSMVLLLVTSLVNAFESVKSITVHITDNSNAGAPYVKATLWFDTTIYQFNIDNPQRNTEYSLSSTEFTTIGQSDCMDASDTKVMIQRNGWNAVYIDWITFETYSGTWYGIDGYCAFDQADIDYYLDPSSDYRDWLQEEPECPLGYNPSYGYTDWIEEESGCPLGYSTTHLHFCVDNDSCASCEPAKQILYFDVSTPNEYITDAVWEDGTVVVPRIVSCNPSNGPTPSPTDPSNRPTASPSYDPSNEPSASPNELTPSPTDNPFAQPTSSPVHAVNAKTPSISPTQPVIDTTILNTNHGSTYSVDMGGAGNDTESDVLDLFIVIWISIGVGFLLFVAIILCFVLWKCRQRKLKDIQQNVIENIVKKNVATNVNGTEFIVPGNVDQANENGDEVLEVVNETIGVEEDHREGAKPNNVTNGNIQDDEFVIDGDDDDGLNATKGFRNTDVETDGNIYSR